jgi:hypothetical protein
LIEYYYPGFEDNLIDGRTLEELFVEDLPISGYLVSYAWRKNFYNRWDHDMEKARAHYDKYGLKLFADSGAFSFIDEPTPPISVNDLIDFQIHVKADLGASLDHIIPDYDASYDYFFGGIPKPPMFKERMDITLENGSAYLKECKAQGVRFTPIGALQGWSPESYLDCLRSFQKMGYGKVALGGIAKLRSKQILEILSALKPHIGETQLHLFGIVRPHLLRDVGMPQITSVDGMGPFFKALRHSKGYYLDGVSRYSLPFPEVDLLEELVSGDESVFDSVLEKVGALGFCEIEQAKVLREVLKDRVWESCSCVACVEAGWRIVTYEKVYTRLRGFHNVLAFKQALRDLRLEGD